MSGQPVSSSTAMAVADNCSSKVFSSSLTDVEVRPFSRTRPFASFGRWVETIRVVRPGTESVLIRWLARRRGAASSYEQLWDACQAANPACFNEYRIARLRRPSFFLPAGEVVFKVMENPTQIPDSPPLGVQMRHMEALDAFPRATFYYLRPVFTADPTARMYTADDLRREAASDCENIVAATRVHGWAIRTADWSRRRLIDAARLALRGATRLLDGIEYVLAPVQRRRLMRMARTADALERRTDLAELADRADHLGLDREAHEFRRAALRLQATFDFDPLLVFEVKSRPGQLWFESHWYVGQDGRTYVHY
jgi:hypothetical protein